MAQKSRISDAIWTAFTESLRFVVVPLILIDLVTGHYPQLTTSYIDQIEMFVIFFGGMIVASSTLEVAHAPGTYKRLMFGLVAVAFVAIWLYIIFGGGIAEFRYGPYFVRFDMTMIVYIMMGGLSLKGLLVYKTFTVYRKAAIEQARKARQKEADRRREAALLMKKLRREAARDSPGFGSMSKVDFQVTADDGVGYTSAPYMKDLPTGMKICEVCGAQSPTKDYVCKNCGCWFPRDSVV